MIDEYVGRIEQVLYLKENQGLIREDRAIELGKVLKKLVKETKRLERSRVLRECKNALAGID